MLLDSIASPARQYGFSRALTAWSPRVHVSFTGFVDHAEVGTKRLQIDRSFIVRVSRDCTGRLSGIVQRVQTGEKHRFAGRARLEHLIARMLAAEDEERQNQGKGP